MAKRALVTGIAGFVGSQLAKRLLEEGWEVFGTDNTSPEAATRLSSIRERVSYTWQGVEDIRADDIAKIVPDAVIHTAAVTDVPYSMTSPMATYQQNAIATATLCEAVKAHPGMKKLIIISSESVYGRAKTIPVPEDSPLYPTNYYGASKAAAEMLARAYFESDGVPVVILRSSSMYGPGGRMTQVIPIFLRQALRGEPITIHGDGAQSRDFNYGGNFIDGIMLALSKARPGEIYNIAGENEISVKDLAEIAIHVTGSASKIVHLPQRRGESGVRLVPDISKARRELGYEPRVSFEEGMALTAAWVEKNLAGTQSVPGGVL